MVLDTNVWVSALLWGGNPAELVKAAEDRRLCIFISEQIVGEISRVLEYPKLQQAYQGAGLDRRDLMEAVLNVGRLVRVSRRVNVVAEHPADDKFIECALAAHADYVVSGDRHLLKVSRHENIRILPVREFLDMLESGSN